mmetsp:Transcript_24193/g.58455  ORF Transcript_24193/g.58455 Transcript_24193/m.58455 type:complete len:484 (+) Transcript_24193:55-1506(+)
MKSAALFVLLWQASPTAAFLSAAPTKSCRIHTTSTIASSLGASAAFSNEDLETAFFSIDIEDAGSIPKSSFADALADLGVVLDESAADALFCKYDADRGGSIDLDEFKELMADPAMAGIKPQRDVKFAMDMFKKYDDDGSGSIDKGEFRAIANEIQADARRRSLFSVAAAAVGATIVADYSQEYQWAQKSFRTLYIEPKAEETQNKAFPTALLSGDLDEAIAKTLGARGFTPANTIFAHSVCSDEVNNKDEQLVALMVNRWQEGFSLGGLAGLPFAGKSGFRAFLHHVPDEGRLLVMFAPHVGIDATGKVGALQRDGQIKVSKACGAAVGAFGVLSSRGATTSKPSGGNDDTDLFDPQLTTIVNLLEPRLGGIEKAVDPISFVTYQMYAIIRDLIDECVEGTPDVWDFANEVSIVGGIMINRYVGGDFFQPLSFETRVKDGSASGKVIDLYDQAFGAKPDLVGVLGSEEAVAALNARSKKSKL